MLKIKTVYCGLARRSFSEGGVSYTGSTHDSGSCRLGSIPSTPTKERSGVFLIYQYSTFANVPSAHT